MNGKRPDPGWPFLNLTILAASECLAKSAGFLSAAYLGRTVYPEGCGVLAFAASFTSWFLLFIPFGSDLYGTGEIARNKANTAILVNNIISLRFVNALVFCLLLVICSFTLFHDTLTGVIIILSGISLISRALTPDWVFLGLEEVKYAAVTQWPSSLLSLICLLLFVRTKADILTAAVISVLPSFLNSILLLAVYCRKFHLIRFSFDPVIWKAIARRCLPLLLSSVMIAVYYNLDTLLLGCMKTDQETGIYSAACRIMRTSIIPFALIHSTFFPALSRLSFPFNKEAHRTFKKYTLCLITAGLAICILLYHFSEEITGIVYGERFLRAQYVLKILSLNTSLVALNILFGHSLIAWGYLKEYTTAVSAGAVSNIVLNIVLIEKYSFIGAAISALLTEAAVFICLIFFFSRICIRSMRDSNGQDPVLKEHFMKDSIELTVSKI